MKMVSSTASRSVLGEGFFFFGRPDFYHVTIKKRSLTKCHRITVSEDLVQSKNLSASSLLMPLSDHHNPTTPGSSGYVSAYSRDGKQGDGEAAPCGTLIYHYAQQTQQTKPEASPSVTPCAASSTASSYASPLSGITSLPSTATADDDDDDDDNLSIISYNSYVDVDGVRTSTTASSSSAAGARREEEEGEEVQLGSEDDYEVVEGSEDDSTADEL